MFKVKLLLLGPTGSGKTSIANFLSDASEHSGGDYRPTQGVRILEFENSNLNVNNKVVKAEIELWDCSGDHRFEPCWPAFQQDAQGIIFVYNPTEQNHPRELEILHNYFVSQAGFNQKNCLVLAYQKGSTGENKHVSKLSNTFSRIPQVTADIEEGNKLQTEFSAFLALVLSGIRDRREQEELNIISLERAKQLFELKIANWPSNTEPDYLISVHPCPVGIRIAVTLSKLRGLHQSLSRGATFYLPTPGLDDSVNILQDTVSTFSTKTSI